MDTQDTKFNYKIILAALLAVVIGLLIAFYYSYANSNTQISYLEHEKELLQENLKIVKADVDRLSALDEVNDYELQSSRYIIKKLQDSVGRLTFTVEKLREYKTELRRLEAKNDSLKLKNDFLSYNNLQLSEKYEASQNEIKKIRTVNRALAQAEARRRDKIQDLNKELKTKKYLELLMSEGSGVRVRSGKAIRTNKASTIKQLKGSIVISADSSMANQEKIIYFQFLGPNMGIIEDNANTINVNGNVYSKRVVVSFTGEETEISDFITIPEGSLEAGDYILNVFENQRLLQSSEFLLK